MFVHIPGGDLAYSVLGLVIFAGFIMFDFQRLRTSRDVTSAPFLAASIFLDLLNVFLSACNPLRDKDELPARPVGSLPHVRHPVTLRRQAGLHLAAAAEPQGGVRGDHLGVG